MKKILCLLLAALMLLSLAACGPTEDGGDTTTKPNTQTEKPEDPNYICDLDPDLNYGGAEVNILFANVTGRDDELVSDNTGGVVSESVHTRNIMVEDMLGVHLNMIPEDSDSMVTSKMDKDIQGGLGDYDIIVNGTYLAVQPAMEGKYLDLNKLDNIDTTKHYWTQGYNDMVTFTDANMQFLASGPIAISMFRYMFLTIYNKSLFEDYNIPDLYQTVKNKEWTLDYQYSISKDHYVEKDGVSNPTEGDFYGFVTGDTISVDPYMVASNIHMVIKDPVTGDLSYNKSAVTSLSDLCDKVQLLYNDQSTYVYRGTSKDDIPYNYVIEHFTDEKALMATTMFLKMESNFKDLAALSYGIAPMPMFSKAQGRYYSYVQDQVSSFGISSVIDPDRNQDHAEMCAAVLEAMAYHSYRLVRPAYYETVLSTRFMQDPQSKEILDMLFDTLEFDFSSTCSAVFSGCVIRDELRPLLSGTTNIIASSTASWGNSVRSSLSRYNKKLQDVKS